MIKKTSSVEAQRTTAQTIVDGLVQEGVPFVFGMTGDTILPILDAIFEQSDRIRYITTKYEMSTLAMADGYSRVTNQLGVAALHVGPAISNGVLGAWSAQKDFVPLLVLSANMDSFRLGRNIWHEFDVIGVFERFTKRADQLIEPKDTARVLRTSIQASKSGLPGVSLIDFPKDLLVQGVDVDSTDVSLQGAAVMGYVGNRPRPEAAAVRQTLQALRSAKSPVIIAGRGVSWSECEAEVVALAEKLGAAVVTTEMGRGSISETHPLSGGLWGHFGTNSANALVSEADLILGLGCQFSNVNTINWKLISADATIVQVEPDPEELGRQYAVDVAVHADSGEFVQDLTSLLEEEAFSVPASRHEAIKERVAQLRELEREAFYAVDLGASPIVPQLIVDTVERRAPEGSIFTIGSGYNTHFSNFLKITEPRQYHYPIGSGTMAWALPAALGIKLAKPEQAVFVLIGDGDFSMSAQELETAVRENLPVVIIIYNDVSFGALRIFQDREYGGRQIGSTYGETDFVKLAEAYGAHGIRVDDPADLDSAVLWAIELEAVVVVDVRIDPQVLAPRTPEFKDFHLF